MHERHDAAILFCTDLELRQVFGLYSEVSQFLLRRKHQLHRSSCHLRDVSHCWIESLRASCSSERASVVSVDIADFCGIHAETSGNVISCGIDRLAHAPEGKLVAVP